AGLGANQPQKLITKAIPAIRNADLLLALLLRDPTLPAPANPPPIALRTITAAAPGDDAVAVHAVYLELKDAAPADYGHLEIDGKSVPIEQQMHVLLDAGAPKTAPLPTAPDLDAAGAQAMTEIEEMNSGIQEAPAPRFDGIELPAALQVGRTAVGQRHIDRDDLPKAAGPGIGNDTRDAGEKAVIETDGELVLGSHVLHEHLRLGQRTSQGLFDQHPETERQELGNELRRGIVRRSHHDELRSQRGNFLHRGAPRPAQFFHGLASAGRERIADDNFRDGLAGGPQFAERIEALL